MAMNKEECYDLSYTHDDDESQLVLAKMRTRDQFKKSRIFQGLIAAVAVLLLLCCVLIILLAVEKTKVLKQGGTPNPVKLAAPETVPTEPSELTSSPCVSQAMTTAPQNPSNRTTNNSQALPEDRCVDKHIFCGYWALIGECTRNPKYMHVSCCVWCSHLQMIKDQNCTDTHNNCVIWTNRGECWKNPAYMLDNCCKACNDKGHSPAGAKRP